MLPERLQRSETEFEVKVGSFFFRDPVARRHAMRHKAADEMRLRPGGCLGQCGRGRHHGFEKWKRERRAAAAKNGSAGNMLLGYEHCLSTSNSPPKLGGVDAPSRKLMGSPLIKAAGGVVP